MFLRSKAWIMSMIFFFLIEFCDQMKINIALLYHEVLLHNKTSSLSPFFPPQSKRKIESYSSVS